MRVFLPLLCVLCASPVHSIFDGACLREDPSPDTLVISPGSKLVLTCSGDVTVNGVKVRNSSNTNRRSRSSDAAPTTVNIVSNTGVSMKSDKQTMENSVSEGSHSDPAMTGDTDTGYTASPTACVVQPTRSPGLLKAKEMDDEADYEDEIGGGRVTRGIKSRPHWRWNGTTVGKGERDWGEIMFEPRGGSLSLSPVRLTDSGRYTCHHRGTERFALKVIVTDPPETPRLSCYKKSPSSKIRCEWKPEKPVTITPKCYLLLNKSPSQLFSRSQCSYSSRASRCWCALDHNENELRTNHMAYLCVTSIAGNATSTVLHFQPLHILKPDPPSNVSVHQEKGQKTKMKVTWTFPISWKSQNSYYELEYELKYRPLMSSLYQEQIQKIKGQRYYMITDAMPGVEYQIQLRTKDEYDGLWSAWSAPVCGRSWKAPVPTDDPATTMFPIYTEGSGSGEVVSDDPEPVDSRDEVSHHIVWISALFALLSVILAVYIFRHKNRFMSKLQSLSVITQCSDSPQPTPSVPSPPEGQALVTFGPQSYKRPPPSTVEEGEEEDEEERCVNERMEAMHFNNTSYFFLQQ